MKFFEVIFFVLSFRASNSYWIRTLFIPSMLFDQYKDCKQQRKRKQLL